MLSDGRSDITTPNFASSSSSPLTSSSSSSATSLSLSKSSSSSTGAHCGEECEKLWIRFGVGTPFPALVKATMQGFIGLEENLGRKLIVGGSRGSLKGWEKDEEEKRRSFIYEGLSESEGKMEHYVAHQVACRVLGRNGYVCHHCWLLFENCICSKIRFKVLWPAIKIWVYMHPKDFLRKNNTGKLLWKVLGTESVNLCLCGMKEHEEAMWNCFKETGQEYVWYVYPRRNVADLCVAELNLGHDFGKLVDADSLVHKVPSFNFVLIDATWNNSKAMVERLQHHARDVWGKRLMDCVTLSPETTSLMHTLRPQPSQEKTCTAAAAVQLLRELSRRKEISGHGVEEAADAIEHAIGEQFHALTSKRERKGWTAIRAKN